MLKIHEPCEEEEEDESDKHIKARDLKILVLNLILGGISTMKNWPKSRFRASENVKNGSYRNSEFAKLGFT